MRITKHEGGREWVNHLSDGARDHPKLAGAREQNNTGGMRLANEKNLIPQAHKLTVEDQSKGGKKSARKRQERKTLREGLLLLLNEPLTDKDGNKSDKTTQDAIIAGLVKRAAAGDSRAFEIIRDTIGEKPVEKIANVTPKAETIENVERALFGDGAK